MVKIKIMESMQESTPWMIDPNIAFSHGHVDSTSEQLRHTEVNPNIAFSHSPESVAQAAENRLHSFGTIERIDDAERLARSLMGVADALKTFMAHNFRPDAITQIAAQETDEPIVYTRIFERPLDQDLDVQQLRIIVWSCGVEVIRDDINGQYERLPTTKLFIPNDENLQNYLNGDSPPANRVDVPYQLPVARFYDETIDDYEEIVPLRRARIAGDDAFVDIVDYQQTLQHYLELLAGPPENYEDRTVA